MGSQWWCLRWRLRVEVGDLGGGWGLRCGWRLRVGVPGNSLSSGRCTVSCVWGWAYLRILSSSRSRFESPVTDVEIWVVSDYGLDLCGMLLLLHGLLFMYEMLEGEPKNRSHWNLVHNKKRNKKHCWNGKTTWHCTFLYFLALAQQVLYDRCLQLK